MNKYNYFKQGIDRDVDKVYLKIQNTFGISFVPNFFKLIANNKNILNGIWTAYEKILAGGMIPLHIKEVIFLYTALEKGCNYCSSTHLAVCDMLKVNSVNIDGIKNDIELVTPTELKLILKLTKNIINYTNDTSEGNEIHELIEIGLSKDEISEILCMIHLADTAVSLALSSGLDDIENEISSYLTEKSLATGLK